MPKEKQILSPAQIKTLLQQFTRLILTANKNPDSLALIGIHKRGVTLAQRLKTLLSQKIKTNIPFGWVDITLYRDDLETIGPAPLVKGTQIDFDLTGKNIILVDDVLFTGRTIRAAIDELMDFGRPRSIQLAVLVDRGGRELPIQPDYAAKKVKIKNNEIINVKLVETDGIDGVWVTRK